ncbi:MAG: VTT domain-containing protein [Clostridia bacterium]|nr:VTT domain-containing protein [Clostridia bacterium]
MADKKDYGKLVKVLQIVTGVIMIALVVVGIVLMNKYDINAKNIPELSEKLSAFANGTLIVSLVMIGIMVVKSFCLILPPAVVMGVTAYVLPNYPLALLVNLIAMALSLVIPYFLGRFTGAGMVDTLKKRFKAVSKIEDFAGANEWKMTAVVKFSGILPGDLSSLLFGAMNISFPNYMVGAIIGNLPLIIVYTLFGSLLKDVDKHPWIVAIPVVVIVAFLLISGVLTKKMISDTKKKAQAQKTETAEESAE